MPKTAVTLPREATRAKNPVPAAGWSGRTLAVRHPGRIGYEPALELQATLVERRRRGAIPDTLLLLEHPHVITLGSSGRAGHVSSPPTNSRGAASPCTTWAAAAT